MSIIEGVIDYGSKQRLLQETLRVSSAAAYFSVNI